MPDSKNHYRDSADIDPKADAKAAQKLDTVTLTGAHTHQGERYKEGDKIQVTAGQKAFLKRIGKIA